MINGGPTAGGSKSLLERVGGPAGNSRNNQTNGYGRGDDIQSRIDNITNSSPIPDPNMMTTGFPQGFPQSGMDMMTAANPVILQEMMMNQMAMMAAMGMMGMPQDMGMYGGNTMGGFQAQMGNVGMNGRGRGGGRGRGVGRGRGPPPHLGQSQSVVENNSDATTMEATPLPSSAAISVPTPTKAIPSLAPALTTGVALNIGGAGFTPPERPQSPTLCKFASKCTNAYCRYSHPSPVATAESGVVLSDEPCEKGRNCTDKDCIKAHVSPAVLNPGEYRHFGSNDRI
jgi:hypothetical protein